MNTINTLTDQLAKNKIDKFSKEMDKFTGEIIKTIREEQKLTQAKLGEMSGIGRTAICNLEKGGASLSFAKTIALNDAFNNYYQEHNIDKKDALLYNLFPQFKELKAQLSNQVSPLFVLNDIEEIQFISLFNRLSETDKTKILHRMDNIIEMYVDESQIPTKYIPLVGKTACGDPIEAIASTEDFIETNELKATFALTAEGDSMAPLINDGDIILVKQVEELNIGEIGIFQINTTGFTTDDSVTCKLLKSIKGNIMTLTPMNPAYDPIIIDTKNENVKIIGKYLSKLS